MADARDSRDIEAAKERQTQRWTNRLANRSPESPSPRTPTRNWWANCADRIERQLQASGHSTWGFVVYRCTYEKDDDWAEFIQRLYACVEDVILHANGADMLEKFSLTVFEDQSLFDDASTAVIRHHFRNWARDAFCSEQSGSGENLPTTPPRILPQGHVPSSYAASQGPNAEGTSPRYRFCVQVDAAALHSILDTAPALSESATTQGWVKLIKADWTPRSENRRLKVRSDPNVCEPIEGLTEDDVGWMVVPYEDVMTVHYLDYVDVNRWSVSYRRPPIVVT